MYNTHTTNIFSAQPILPPGNTWPLPARPCHHTKKFMPIHAAMALKMPPPKRQPMLRQPNTQGVHAAPQVGLVCPCSREDMLWANQRRAIFLYLLGPWQGKRPTATPDPTVSLTLSLNPKSDLGSSDRMRSD